MQKGDYMVYCSTYVTEGIVFHHQDDADDVSIIAITKDLDGKTFTVDTDLDEEWEWKFVFTPANYEMVKYAIMDEVFGCDNEDELLMELDCLFDDVLGDIVVWEDKNECGCGGSCGHCNCKE